MSHFTVLVIGENPEQQLQPFHEYECTGIKDEYVVNVDKTEEVNEWLKEEVFIGNKKDGGELDYEYSEEKATANLISPRKADRKEYLQSTGRNIDEEIKEYHGYDKDGDRWTRFTNPNKKWDWYKLGGRWTGFFKLKLGAKGITGEPGLMTEKARPGYADAAYKRDIDFEFMRTEAANEAAQRYDFASKILNGLPTHATWEEIREANKDDASNVRDVYWNQPRCKAWLEARNANFKECPFSFSNSPDDFLIDKETYLAQARDGAVSTHAVIKDGKWYECGEMGWWGVVHNEKEGNVWHSEFAKLLDSISDDTIISVYDCHI